MDAFKIGPIGGMEEIPRPRPNVASAGPAGGFADSLKQAINEVDRVQKESEAAQVAYARGEEGDLHEVLIRIEEAEIAFKSMMEVRSKLVEAYREVMRIGAGG